MRTQPGHNTQPHVRLPTSFLGMDAWMTSKLNVDLICKLREPLVYLDYLWDAIPRCLYNQALAIVRSTGAGIRCLNCMYTTYYILWPTYYMYSVWMWLMSSVSITSILHKVFMSQLPWSHTQCGSEQWLAFTCFVLVHAMNTCLWYCKRKELFSICLFSTGFPTPFDLHGWHCNVLSISAFICKYQ